MDPDKSLMKESYYYTLHVIQTKYNKFGFSVFSLYTTKIVYHIIVDKESLSILMGDHNSLNM